MNDKELIESLKADIQALKDEIVHIKFIFNNHFHNVKNSSDEYGSNSIPTEGPDYPIR